MDLSDKELPGEPAEVGDALDAGYEAMASNEEAERKALEWAEAMIGDVADDL